MYTFIKANVASLSAATLDFGMYFGLVHFLGLDVLPATILSTLTGGILNFLMGRTWVFGAEKGAMDGQLVKYILVWSGSFVLNTAGVYILVKGMGVHYLIAKVCVAVAVGVSYNYFLQKRYVFAHN